MNTPRYQILVVEGDTTDAARLAQRLRASSVAFDVVVRERLVDAVNWLAEHECDLVLLDMTFPDVSPMEAFEAVYGERPDVPVVILSGRDDEQMALRAVRGGAQDYIVKSEEEPAAQVRALQYAIERFRAGRMLREREEHMRLLTRQLPCAFWTTDIRLRLTSFSGAEGLAGLRLRSPELVGTTLLDYFDAEQDPLVEAHRRAAEGQSETLDWNWLDRIYHVHVEPFRRPGGQIVGTIGVALDITDQKLIDLELRVTRQVQEGLRPGAAPRLEGMDLAGHSASASAAGGDYFDYFPIADGTLGVVVCDVAGHGLGPAMMMCQTRAYLRALALSFCEPAEILERTNAFLIADTGEERLVPLFFAKVDAARHRVQYANAGHRGHVVRVSGECELIPPTGIPLNVMPDYQTAGAAPIDLRPGDLMLLYSDGIVESSSPGGEMFGLDRLVDLVSASRRDRAAAIVERLFAAVHAHTEHGPLDDDMTAVVIKAAL